MNGSNMIVIQKDLNGKTIKVFNSVTSASKILNIKRDLILRCCKGKQKRVKNNIFEYGV